MKMHAALLAFFLLAVVLAVAQTPAGGGRSQSATSPDAQTAPNSSSDASATPPVSGGQNDGSLQSQIENALRNEPALSNSHIAVHVTGDSIDLSGTVGSGKDKQTAERIAQSFDGNRKLNDNLTIAGHGHSDSAPDHSAMNNSGTANTQNPTTGQDGANNPPSMPPKR